jgi:hypothetical protein
MFAGLPPSSSSLTERKSVFRQLLLHTARRWGWAEQPQPFSEHPDEQAKPSDPPRQRAGGKDGHRVQRNDHAERKVPAALVTRAMAAKVSAVATSVPVPGSAARYAGTSSKPIAIGVRCETVTSVVRAVRAAKFGTSTWAASFVYRPASSRQVAPHMPRERYERLAGLLRSVAVISVNCSASSLAPGSVRSVSGTEQTELVSSLRGAAAACNVIPMVVRRWIARGRPS